jgi:diguanylate cyclase (GGDEF)-like protein
MLPALPGAHERKRATAASNIGVCQRTSSSDGRKPTMLWMSPSRDAPDGQVLATSAPSVRAHRRRRLVADLAGALPAVPAADGLVLLLADVDDFRRYNAHQGQRAGDALLADVGRRLALASGRRAYRFSADAFAVLLAGPPVALWRQAAAVLAALGEVRCCFGAATPPLDGSTTAQVLAAAEDRLEDQKKRRPILADRMVELLLTIVHGQRPQLDAHTRGVAELTEGVGARLGLDAARRTIIRRTAELHDVGKLAIDPVILEKTGALDAAEWAVMRRHTVVAEELLQSVEPLRPVGELVRATHERWDGGGYPDGRRGEEIPLEARIVAACDAYDAMTSDRPYRRAIAEAAARAELKACAGEQFDPTVVHALLAELTEAPARPSLDALGESATTLPRSPGSLGRFARLHALLEEASLIETAEELPRALERIAAVVAETLGFEAVVINLHRPEWDDFVATTVHATEAIRHGLLGSTYGWEVWERLLDERFSHEGAYLVYQGELDWNDQPGKRVVADVEPSDRSDGWQPDDEIFVPLRHAQGHLLGVFNVGCPTSGRRPSREEVEMLVIVSSHAARAVQRAQEAAAAAAHRRSLEQLLRVSSQLNHIVSADSVLQAICTGIAEALGFGRVSVHLPDPDTGVLVPAAAAGMREEERAAPLPFRLADLEPIFDDAFEVEGCYLLSVDEAEQRLGSLDDVSPSAFNGRGARAWNRHWLLVPLLDRDGAMLGAILADDPHDRLLPSKERLQALRLFANQATNALDAASRYETARLLADRDPLTQLLNRRAFMRHLAELSAPRGRAAGALTLVYCDLDGFKGLNDTRGHAAGDRVLERFSDTLLQSVRRDDSVFRIGGDEFAMLLHRCGRDQALDVVARVLARLDEGAAEDAALRAVRASFGIAVVDGEEDIDPELLLRRADEAMYDAKRSRSTLRVAA